MRFFFFSSLRKSISPSVIFVLVLKVKLRSRVALTDSGSSVKTSDVALQLLPSNASPRSILHCLT